MRQRDTKRPQTWQVALRSGDQVQVMVRDKAINFLVNLEQLSYTFDPTGRLHGAFHRGMNYRRSLDNRVLCKWSEQVAGRRQRRRRWLSEAEAKVLVENAYDWSRRALSLADDAPDTIKQALQQVAGWDWAALQADRGHFQRIYTPVGILPPDQYLALVLQATQGCSHNACTFCSFYQGTSFRIKSVDEFRTHIAAVLAFFGPALAMRRSLFLADANALVIPMPRLLGLLDVLTDFAPLRGFSINAFIDAFHAHRKRVADWQELAGRGLRRVYIGMESGHDPLLRWLNKPGTAQDVLDAVGSLKEAGVSVSVIILLGAGGDRYAAGHLADTIDLLNAMPLGAGDIIYLSHFVDSPLAPYRSLAQEAGIKVLDSAALREQELALRSALVPNDPSRPPRVAPYSIEEFLY